MKIEKWYIEINDDNKRILKKFYKTLPVTHKVSFSGYLSNIDAAGDGSFLDYSHCGTLCEKNNCTKITIEQFLEMYPEYNIQKQNIDLIL